MPHKEERRKPHCIGTVMHVSKSTGQLIVKAREEASIGDFVYDLRRKRVGAIFDFFGSVDSPYISVRPHSDPTGLVGTELFVEERRKDKRR